MEEGKAQPMTMRPTFRSQRPDGRFSSTLGFLHAYAKANPPGLAFDPDLPAADLPAWRQTVRDKLREMLRFPEVPPQPSPNLLWEEPRDGYRLQKWEAYPEPLSVVSFLVLLPEGCDATHPAPGVLCCPGSDWSKESLAGEPELDGAPPKNHHWPNNRQALFYVRAGFVAVATDNPGIGEQSDAIHPERREISLNGLWLGRGYESLSVFHRLPILQWLKDQPFVDPRRIATSGLSLGAKPALLLAVLDPEVAACVWNDFASLWRMRMIVENMDCIALHQYVPDLLAWLDYPDLMASLAPRPLLISEGGRGADLNLLRRAYELAGAPEALEVVYYPRYATPDLRPLDDLPLPEGLTSEEYFKYANVDAPNHEFKPEVCVPWLARTLRASE
jgi:hypothetical protein